MNDSKIKTIPIDKEVSARILADYDPERLASLKHKKECVTMLSDAFRKAGESRFHGFGSAAGCELLIVCATRADDPTKTHLMEYLRIDYDGGAWTYRNAGGNSLGADLREIAELIYGGHYDEVPFVEDLLKTSYLLEFDEDGTAYLAKEGR